MSYTQDFSKENFEVIFNSKPKHDQPRSQDLFPGLGVGRQGKGPGNEV